MVRRTTCFYAYPFRPRDLSESITRGIQLIRRDAGADLEIIDWQDLRSTGRILIDAICQRIDECDVFACDLTTLNANVLFELGFAMAKNKRIWISLDVSRPSAVRDYRSFILSDIGYAGYENGAELCNRFLQDAPHETLEKHVLAQKNYPG